LNSTEKAKKHHGDPVAAFRPAAFHQQRYRQQNEKAGAEAEYAERHRIGGVNDETRGAAGDAADGARGHRRQDADVVTGHGGVALLGYLTGLTSGWPFSTT
jgi:hypothetical protein